MIVPDKLDGKDISNKGERYVPRIDPYNAAMHLGHMASYKTALRYAYNRKILDLGCGTGYGSHFLASFGAKKVIACDLSEEALKYAKRFYGHPSVEYINIDLNITLPFKDKSFDFVFCSQVIEHISEPIKLLFEIKRVLNSGGFCLVTEPNKDLFSPESLENSNEYHVNEMNLIEFKASGKRVFPLVEVRGIPQNCLELDTKGNLNLKTNKAVFPSDFLMRSDNVEKCENLLMFAHTLRNGNFSNKLPLAVLDVSKNLAPFFLDPVLNEWIILDNYPKTLSTDKKPSKYFGIVYRKFYSKFEKLYRIDVSLSCDCKCKIRATLFRDSPGGKIVYREIVKTSGNKLFIRFPPVENSADNNFCLKLKAKYSIIQRLMNFRHAPLFEYVENELNIQTFHRI
ncbi:class I SAM-dependent methyltransferase [Acidobacteriota bacterium]